LYYTSGILKWIPTEFNTTVVKRCGRFVKNVKSTANFQIVTDVKSYLLFNQNFLHYGKIKKHFAPSSRFPLRGFFGSHGQALETIAKRVVFIERFKESPITITDNVLIEFTGPIRAEGKGWTHVTPPDKAKSA